MKKQLFEGNEPHDIIKLLEDNCDGMEAGQYVRHLTEEDIVVFKDQLAEAVIAHNNLEKEFALVKQEYKMKMQPFAVEIDTATEAIKTRTQDFEGTLYMFKDEEAGMMGYYDDKGELVNSRRLRPEEKQQRSIFSVNRGGELSIDDNIGNAANE